MGEWVGGLEAVHNKGKILTISKRAGAKAGRSQMHLYCKLSVYIYAYCVLFIYI